MKELPKEKEKKMQELYFEFQMLQNQAEQLNRYMEELEGKMQEFVLTKENISRLGQVPVNNQAMVSLAPGIFAKGQINENQKFIVNVGANILVEKTVPQITEMLSTQIHELSQTQIQLEKNMQTIHQRIDEVVKDLQVS